MSRKEILDVLGQKNPPKISYCDGIGYYHVGVAKVLDAPCNTYIKFDKDTGYSLSENLYYALIK